MVNRQGYAVRVDIKTDAVEIDGSQSAADKRERDLRHRSSGKLLSKRQRDFQRPGRQNTAVGDPRLSYGRAERINEKRRSELKCRVSIQSINCPSRQVEFKRSAVRQIRRIESQRKLIRCGHLRVDGSGRTKFDQLFFNRSQIDVSIKCQSQKFRRVQERIDIRWIDRNDIPITHFDNATRNVDLVGKRPRSAFREDAIVAARKSV